MALLMARCNATSNSPSSHESQVSISSPPAGQILASDALTRDLKAKWSIHAANYSARLRIPNPRLPSHSASKAGPTKAADNNLIRG